MEAVFAAREGVHRYVSLRFESYFAAGFPASEKVTLNEEEEARRRYLIDCVNVW